MANLPSNYGMGSGGVPSMERNLGYDSYVEMAKTRAAMEKSVVLQVAQTALLGNIAGTLHGISNEMAQIRGLHEDTLAIQQEMIQREVMQQQMEELIYQADKLVTECNTPKTAIPPSSQFFLLQGLLKTVEREGIGTPIIRGRDNKKAFEHVVEQAHILTQRLLKEPEVQEAIAWAKAEQKRLGEQRDSADRERRRRVKELRGKLERLQEKNAHQPFAEWHEARLGKHFKEPAAKFIVLGLLWFFYGFLWIPAWYLIEQMTGRNQKNAGKIQKIEDELRELDG